MSVARSAYIVPVWTKRLGGGRPMLVCYIAGVDTPEAATLAVKEHIEALEGDDLREPVAVSAETAAALKIAHGQVAML
jgi:hypothetical protein